MNNVAALKPEVENTLNEKTEQIAQGTSFLTNPALSLICFGGKGGVGKTTSAAATALYLAKNNPQKRILLASIDPAHSLMDSIKDAHIPDNLNVWEINARDSLQRFIERHSNALKKIIERGTFLDETDISNLFSISLPGIDELMGMTELADLMETNTHDVVILDTAPTGHTIKFLQIPQLIRRWTHVLDLMMEKHRYLSKLYLKRYQPDDADAFIGALTNSAEKIERILQNKSCEFVPVMLPESLSVNETLRFLAILEKHKILVNNIIINRIYPQGDCAFCNGQFLLQKKYVDEMNRYSDRYNFLTIPFYKDEVHGKEPLLRFAHAMMESFHLNHELLTYPSQNISHAGQQSAFVQQNTVQINEFRSTTTLSPPLINGDLGGHSENIFQNKQLGVCGGKSPYAPTIDIENFSLPAPHNPKETKVKIKNIFPDRTSHFPVPKSSIEFTMFSGKGGVGKTTLASATALTLSALYPKKRILLFSTDPAHSLSDCLGVTIGDDGLLLKKNLYVQEMNAEKEYQKLKRLYSEEIQELLDAFVKKGAAVNIVFEREIMESLMDITPPGIDEVMALTRIMDYMDNKNFDIFILDTAPTGHLMRFLEMPELALDWLKFFFNLFLKYKNAFHMPQLSAFLVDLSKKIKRLLALLRDAERSLFIPIAIPTEMAYEETKDLVEAVKRLNIPISRGISNMVHPAFEEYASDSKCLMCKNRILYEEKMLYDLERLFQNESLCIVYKQEKEVVGIEALQLLGKKLYEYH
jgi:arsenite-transporting ATPase